MEATKDLRAEHVVVARMLDALEAAAHRAAGGNGADTADFKRAIEFMDVFVDRCHHSKEEVVLFPIMRREAIEEQATIDRLLQEHDGGRALVRRMAAAVDAIEAGGSGATREFEGIVKEHAAHLRAHIEFEERTFDVADRLLPDLEQAAMADEYERIEREVIGPSRHEELHALVDSMESRYLEHALA